MDTRDLVIIGGVLWLISRRNDKETIPVARGAATSPGQTSWAALTGEESAPAGAHTSVSFRSFGVTKRLLTPEEITAENARAAPTIQPTAGGEGTSSSSYITRLGAGLVKNAPALAAAAGLSIATGGTGFLATGAVVGKIALGAR